MFERVRAWKLLTNLEKNFYAYTPCVWLTTKLGTERKESILGYNEGILLDIRAIRSLCNGRVNPFEARYNIPASVDI